jgi:uncharacterized coiled-coil protein SlyX
MSDSVGLERRVRQLEELVSHQQHLLEQLNQVIVDLRGDLEGLNRQFIYRLLDLQSQLGRREAEDPDEKPPHY